MNCLFSGPGLRAAAIIMALSQPALSASPTGTLNIGLTLEDGSCELKSVPSIDFGTYANLVFKLGRRDIEKRSDIVINCAANTGYTLTLGAGLNDDNEGHRLMRSAKGNLVWYYLMFGRESIETFPLDENNKPITRGKGTGADEPITVVAGIPQNMRSPNPLPGVYKDTVTLILTF